LCNFSGGTLKIYGESIKPDVPYKTLLLSTADNVRYVIRETMDKYGMDFTINDPEDFCLMQVRNASLARWCQDMQCVWSIIHNQYVRLWSIIH
jgi:afadin